MKRIDYIKRFLFLRKGIQSFESSLNFDSFKNSKIVFITIAFNNDETLRLQIQMMNKYVKDSFHHVIIDNSSGSEKSNKIKELALSENRSWIRLVHNLNFGPSHSHALAIDWAIKHIIKSCKVQFFGLLDHDIYPFKECSFFPLLEKQKVYGHIQERGSIWYLWPGFAFFDSNVLPDNISFKPGAINGINVDTGGLLFESVFSKLQKKEFIFCKHSYIKLNDGEIAQKDKVELLDDWLHSFNGSYWMKTDKKEDKLELLLSNLEKGSVA